MKVKYENIFPKDYFLQVLNKNYIKNYIKKGGVTVIDQGIFSFSLLVIHILLARWMKPVEYGAFTVAYSILILLQSLYIGFFYEPMIIFGSGKYKANQLKYLQTLIHGHFIISAFSGIILILCSLILFKTTELLKYSFLGLGIGMPFIFLFNLIRRFYYLRLEPQKAALSSMIYFWGILLSIYILFCFKRISPFAAFVAIGGVSFVIGLSILKYFYPQFKLLELNDDNIDLKTVAIDHFKYGKWSGSANLINWIPTNIYFVVLPFFTNIEETGALRALVNFSAPMQQLIGALNLLFLPLASKMYSEKQIKSLQRVVSLYTIFIFILTITYWLVLGLFGNNLIDLLYKGKYLKYANLLWLVGFLPLLSTVSLPRSYALRAMKRPDRIFFSYIVTVFFSVFGIIFIIYWGIIGAIMGLLISTIVNCLCIFYWYKKIIKTKRED